ncbi:exosortase A [Erythrobacter sp.]|uniref:exosortase A n=1 Tax=Erythrobacter sp. TaxID=1042 RepID=UPI001425F45D|nr:exosortase A [Erythrobacter sp.]QIQ85961.1 MAG: exosortase [Erythrobacter sp.]
MPPEAVTFTGADRRTLEGGWRAALTRLGLAAAALACVSAREWGEMLHQWWNIDTYNHILIVPFILAWLVGLKREALAEVEPRAWWPGVMLVGAALALWGTGRASGINLIAHAGAVGALQGAAVALLGPRIAALLALPLGFAVFLVPFGDELIPALQVVTAEIAAALTRMSGIPAELDGLHILTPFALFIVAEACSGVKFLAATLALGVLVGFTRFASWRRRAMLLGACIVVPILANGVRAWGTIMVARSFGIEAAEGFDHIVYGWVFFALVTAGLLAAAWPFFEREPEEHSWGLAQLEGSPVLTRFERGEGQRRGVFAAILGLSLLAAIVALAPLG